ADAGAAVPLDRRPEEAERSHLVHDLPIEALVAVRLEDARHQLFLAIGARRLHHHPLVFGKLIGEQQRIFPAERGTTAAALRVRRRRPVRMKRGGGGGGSVGGWGGHSASPRIIVIPRCRQRPARRRWFRSPASRGPRPARRPARAPSWGSAGPSPRDS